MGGEGVSGLREPEAQAVVVGNREPVVAPRAPVGFAPGVDRSNAAPVRVGVRRGYDPAPRSPAQRFLRNLAFGAGVVVLLHLFVVQVSVVRGHSMRPSLCDGDRLVVDRLAYQVADVTRFDVVVLRYPADPSVDFVKRVVGLPGDRVCLVDGALHVNGVEVAEGFTHVQDCNDCDERIVPNGHYFVLGDNRPISCDSRDFGMVAQELLKGKVRACFWPLHRLTMF